MQTYRKPSVTQMYRGHRFAPDIFIRRLLIIGMVCVFLISSLAPIKGVRGQAEDVLLVQAPDTSEFPEISLQVDLPESIDISGNDLSVTQLRVLEDGREVSVRSLQKEYSGVHFTMAINGGREFDLRDTAGVSNFDKLRTVLRNWALKREFIGGDAWSLVSHDGMKVTNVSHAEDWIDALDTFKPDFRAMKPDLKALDTAIKFSEARVVNFGVEKSVLYLTMPPNAEEIDEIYDLAERARSAGIQVNIWMVGDPLYLRNEQGGALITLAESTGGVFYHFSKTEKPPDPGAWLSKLGFIYKIQYDSHIRKAGTYPLQIEIDWRDRIYQGESPPFYLDIFPPKPILIDPPAVISRRSAGAEEINSGGRIEETFNETLYPDFQAVKVKISFPDGFPREIVSSRLYVNGVVVAVNNSPPFDVLSWDLSEFIQSGEEIIQVEIIDLLGLTGFTNEYPVRVVVDQPDPDVALSVSQMILLLGGILLGLIILSLVVWGAIHFRRKVLMKPLKEGLKRHIRNKEDQTTRLPTKSEQRFATLIPSGKLDQDWENHAIRITRADGIFGSQTDRVDYLLSEPSVDGLQARLTLHAGEFWLSDLDSTLGTWVNYHRIGTKPVNVHPGDLIHFGNCGFRFTMVEGSLPDTACFTSYEPLL